MCGWRSIGHWAVALASACAAPRAPAPTPIPLAAAPAHSTTAPASAVADAKPESRFSVEELPPELPEFDGKPLSFAVAPAGTALEPARCRELISRPPAIAAACADRDAAVPRLAAALEAETSRRDRELHALESCEGLPPGFVRAVRAELDRDCAETLATPLLQRPPPGVSAEVMQTLRGLALASRFVRSVPAPPVMKAPVDPQRIEAFVAGPLSRYLADTRARLELLALGLNDLPEQSHGRAVALAGRAVAWQRIRRLRGHALPEPLKKTYTLRVQYFERIDALLAGHEAEVARFTHEATKSAWLHGLLRDRTLEQHLLQVHDRSRLRWLALPRPESDLSASPWFRIASRLPARYPAELLSMRELAQSQKLAELAPGGLSFRQKRAWSRPGKRSDLRVLAELYLKLGLVLHRDEATRESARLAELVEQPNSRDLLLLALIRDLSRAAGVATELLALADDATQSEAIRAIASYDAAVLLSEKLSTRQAAYQRLRGVRGSASDPVLRDCAGAYQHELSDTWRFEPVPQCRSWPWLGD